MKKIAIIGCGAIGTIMGAYMSKNGLMVDMVDAYEAHVNALNEKGATVIGMDNFTVPVRAMTPDKMEGIYDLVILMTKQTANDIVFASLLPHLDENSVVCTLQNGVPEPYVAEHIGAERTIGGAVMWSATFVEPGVSELTQDISNIAYMFEIGELDGSITPRIQEACKVLEVMGKPSHITETLMISRWGKLVYNACMSGMSAACGTTFGGVLDIPAARACLSYIGRELNACCEAEGYKLPVMAMGCTPESFELKDQAMFDENQQIWLKMYSVARPAKASMLQDLEKGNRTEVPMINGYVSQVGKKHGIATPFCDKVVEIVSKIEKGELPLSEANVELFDKSWFEFALYEE